MYVDEQDREQVDSERESRRGRRQNKNRQRPLKHVMTCAQVILSDTRCDTLSHNVMCAQGQICQPDFMKNCLNEKKALRGTRIRNIHEVEELKRAQEIRIDEFCRHEVRESR